MSYQIEAVGSSSAPDFAEGYAALAGEFASRGELERREVIAHWLDEPRTASSGDGLQRTYHLLVARDDQGALAGVRDCHVILDPSGVAVVYLAHALVLPAYRRTGLGALFRSEPLAIGRRVIGEAGLSATGVDLLLAAEMEPASLEDEASVVRLRAYGRAGFAAIAPSRLPYCQPDFRDLDDSSIEKPRPIPLLAIVRFIGHDDARSLPARLARAFVTHLYAVFATHVRAEHLRALQAATLGVLDSVPEGEVPLIPLPRTLDDRTTLSALSHAAVLRSFPPELR